LKLAYNTFLLFCLFSQSYTFGGKKKKVSHLTFTNSSNTALYNIAAYNEKNELALKINAEQHKNQCLNRKYIEKKHFAACHSILQKRGFKDFSDRYPKGISIQNFKSHIIRKNYVLLPTDVYDKAPNTIPLYEVKKIKNLAIRTVEIDDHAQSRTYTQTCNINLAHLVSSIKKDTLRGTLAFDVHTKQIVLPNQEDIADQAL